MKEEIYVDSDGSKLVVRIDFNGDKYYSNCNNELHRLDGPAIEHLNGDFTYVKNEQWHRIGGPARYYIGKKSWYINDKQIEIYYICG